MTTEHSYQETSRDNLGYLTSGSVTYTCECGDSYIETLASIQSTVDSMEITDFDTVREIIL